MPLPTSDTSFPNSRASRPLPACASQYIINGSGQLPTMCEIPDPKRPDLGKWKVVLCVDEKENGKNGAKLKVRPMRASHTRATAC